ncbi:hypothetical protein Trco_002029 [Trichoderma cornu-damae]|uniref:Uncharacterized protein n=1 Tax=Trichoderma cornu-damae TaxID=654480 RepID=A0A9P8QTW0_9HYPO|nr:hypothetical protein Trco_002029 [Trichoderma cornu-damae]
MIHSIHPLIICLDANRRLLERNLRLELLDLVLQASPEDLILRSFKVGHAGGELLLEVVDDILDALLLVALCARIFVEIVIIIVVVVVVVIILVVVILRDRGRLSIHGGGGGFCHEFVGKGSLEVGLEIEVVVLSDAQRRVLLAEIVQAVVHFAFGVLLSVLISAGCAIIDPFPFRGGALGVLGEESLDLCFLILDFFPADGLGKSSVHAVVHRRRQATSSIWQMSAAFINDLRSHVFIDSVMVGRSTMTAAKH